MFSETNFIGWPVQIPSIFLNTLEFLHYLVLISNECRNGWPLLTVEKNGASEDLWSKMKGSFLGWFVGLSCRCNWFLSCLGCSGQPSKTIFFLTVYYSYLCVPSPSNLCRQSCRAASLWMCVFMLISFHFIAKLIFLSVAKKHLKLSTYTKDSIIWHTYNTIFKWHFVTAAIKESIVIFSNVTLKKLCT